MRSGQSFFLTAHNNRKARKGVPTFFCAQKAYVSSSAPRGTRRPPPRDSRLLAEPLVPRRTTGRVKRPQTRSARQNDGTQCAALGSKLKRSSRATTGAWFDRLATIFSLIEEGGVWPDGLLDGYISMIPKSDGDATPLGQRPLCVLHMLIGCRLLLGFNI